MKKRRSDADFTQSCSTHERAKSAGCGSAVRMQRCAPGPDAMSRSWPSCLSARRSKRGSFRFSMRRGSSRRRSMNMSLFLAELLISEAVEKGLFSLLDAARLIRSEEHTSELQSLMRNSYAVFCLKKKK